MSVQKRLVRRNYEPVPERSQPPKPPASDLELIRACKLWDKITSMAHANEFEMPESLEHAGTNQPYAGVDYTPLQCRIDGKKAELTVGSSPGHKVHVDLAEKILEYYDNDAEPNQVMNDLLEEAGLKCETEHEGVKCKGVTQNNVQAVFKVLAMPTSMDFRLSHCKRTQADPEQECRDQVENESPEDYGYKVPDGCDCEQWTEDMIQDCVDNYDYSGIDSEDCL